MSNSKSNTKWADEPYELIVLPSKYRDINSHYSVWAACEMANVHNTILRGLNAIILQAPYVASSNQQEYKSQDVKDLLFYIEAWVKCVEWHHHTEETVMFPKIEELTGKKGLLDGSVEQHHAFHTQLVRLQEYSESYQKKPAEYRWDDLKDILDKLGPPLTQHLYEEVDIFLSFDRLSGADLKRAWDIGEEHAKAKGSMSFLYDIFPSVLGTADRTYEGSSAFPPLPVWMPYLIKYWFARNNGAWRFSPCDFWGQPRPLEMLRE